jgi:hypothetical protein
MGGVEQRSRTGKRLESSPAAFLLLLFFIFLFFRIAAREKARFFSLIGCRISYFANNESSSYDVAPQTQNL